jgi:hypothetical protein
MSYFENPASQVVPRPSALKVLKQRQECLLHHFLSIRSRKPSGKQVSQKRAAQLVEQIDHFVFESGVLPRGGIANQ